MTLPDHASTIEPSVCPRHPDRVAYVRCQRCGRPACPDCQRQAAVGVHCVDCVREAARTAPQTRTAFGAPVRTGRPVVTLTIIALCLVSFVLQLTVGWEWEGRWIFSPAIGEYEPWRYLTSGFLHSRSMLLHIAFNLYALWLVGPFLEQQLGRARFIALYVLSELGGSVALLLLGDFYGMAVGASGAVFGLFGAVLLVLRRIGGDARQILIFLGLNTVLGFVVPGIAWEAHLGGLAVGLLLGAAFVHAPRERRGLVGVLAPAGVAALLLVTTVTVYALV